MHFDLHLSGILTEGYAAGHCPYLDQCVFTHMDAQDVLAWLKVGPYLNYIIFVMLFTLGWISLSAINIHFSASQEDFNRHYLTNKAPYTLAMHTNWFQEENQVLIYHRYLSE